MSDFFGGGGGFSSGGSLKSNLDNYYTYSQTSGGSGSGSPSGGKNCGTSSTIIIVILVALAIQNIATAFIVLGCVGLIGLIIFLIPNDKQSLLRRITKQLIGKGHVFYHKES